MYIECSVYHFWRKMDELQAINCLKNGDIGGLEALVGLYQVRAVRTAYLITQDAALAEDVVQESFLQAYRSIRHFDLARPFGPWFMRSVVHAAVKATQRDSRQAGSGSSESTLEGLFEGASVEDQLETAEFQQQVEAALQALPPRHRAVIVQRYFLEMSEKEMATRSDTAPGTIKWLLHGARERLRALLSERNTK
jgi:RNA polymerase sigma-70 factor, ECF subfamily